MTISVALTVVYVALAAGGLVFTLACILFNIIFREKRYHFSKACTEKMTALKHFAD